jgi:hypothetical protein
MPRFWKIRKIVVVAKNLAAIQFVMQPLDTICFNSHFQGYEVTIPDDDQLMEIRQQKEFTCYIPKHLCRPYGRRVGATYVCTRFDLGTNN